MKRVDGVAFLARPADFIPFQTSLQKRNPLQSVLPRILLLAGCKALIQRRRFSILTRLRLFGLISLGVGALGAVIGLSVY
jgi:hypothetical protein